MPLEVLLDSREAFLDPIARELTRDVAVRPARDTRFGMCAKLGTQHVASPHHLEERGAFGVLCFRHAPPF